MKEWRDVEHNVSYYYVISTGKIVGQVYNLSHTKIYGTKVYSEKNEELYLGQYISCDHAKKAIEYFWNIQERTLSDETTS
jgi:hypothetical protein